jgi:hypothetical protein
MPHTAVWETGEPEPLVRQAITVTGTSQQISHACEPWCADPQITTYTQILVSGGGDHENWYFAECATCDTISAFSNPPVVEDRGR